MGDGYLARYGRFAARGCQATGTLLHFGPHVHSSNHSNSLCRPGSLALASPSFSARLRRSQTYANALSLHIGPSRLPYPESMRSCSVQEHSDPELRGVLNDRGDAFKRVVPL